MGLDMYLTRKTYVENWHHMTPEQRHAVTVTGPRAKLIQPERISRVEEQVGYWRKANAIHNWFVKYVQGGVDECQDSYVSRAQLADLLFRVRQVLYNSELVEGVIQNGSTSSPETGGQIVPVLEKGKIVADVDCAQDLLPTTSGFFFGSTDYDENYIDDLKHTKQIIEAILAVPDKEDDASYHYHASW